jgi:DNA-binding response OmpR family regulator
MGKIEGSGSTILLVEDEESLAIGLEYNLMEEGYTVIRAAHGREALERYDPDHIDLIILDVMLPHMDGYEVAEKIRTQSPQVPILMLTARRGVENRIRGLETGADDYMTKPFHLRELLLRIQGMLKRSTWYREHTATPEEITFGSNAVNFNTLLCTSFKKNFRLTPLEADLMRYLYENSGRVLSRRELLKEVWKSTSRVETRTVDNFIRRLRKYFESDPKNPRYFKNVRGAGYVFLNESGDS